MIPFNKEELEMMADGIVLIKEQCNMSEITRSKLDKLDAKLCSMFNNCCQHESDGYVYCSFPPQNKCIKCGEFYR